jgi:hypothetical protein
MHVVRVHPSTFPRYASANREKQNPPTKNDSESAFFFNKPDININEYWIGIHVSSTLQ